MNIHRIVASISAVALVGTVALAQGRRDRDRSEVRVHIKSENYRRAHKDVVNRGVRLVRQTSKSPCVQGRTWGYTGRRIWVDKGCEGDFAYVPR